MYKSERYQVEIHNKANLTLDEAAAYFNIGKPSPIIFIYIYTVYSPYLYSYIFHSDKCREH